MQAEKRRTVNRAGSSGWIMVVLIYDNVLRMRIEVNRNGL